MGEPTGEAKQIASGGGGVKVRVGGPTGEVKQIARGGGSRSEWEDLQVRQNRHPGGGGQGQSGRSYR